MRRVLPEPPRVVYRRAKNLKDIVTSSTTQTPQFIGSGPCKKARCKLCPMMPNTQVVQSTASSFSFQIRGNFDCDSANVVYLLQCTICSTQYIGQTETPLRVRINNHRYHIKTLTNLPLSKHVTCLGHPFDKFTVTVLKSKFRTHHEREMFESFLFHKFVTVAGDIIDHQGTFSFLST